MLYLVLKSCFAETETRGVVSLLAPGGQDQSLKLQLILWGFTLGRIWSGDVKAGGKLPLTMSAASLIPWLCLGVGSGIFSPKFQPGGCGRRLWEQAVLSGSAAALGREPRPRSSCWRSSEPWGRGGAEIKGWSSSWNPELNRFSSIWSV